MFSPAAASLSSVDQEPSNIRPRFQNPTICYSIPDNSPLEDFMNVSLACALACTSRTGTLQLYKNLLVTYVNAMLNGVVGKLRASPVSIQIITGADLEKLRTIFDRNDNLADDDEIGNPIGAWRDFRCNWNLPVLEDFDDGFVSYSRNEKVMFSHLSCVIFLAGKDINPLNRAAITTARPQALINKFGINSHSILTGNARMSDESHPLINQAWLELSEFKQVLFTEFSAYTHKSTNLAQDIILTNVNLMRNARMQHAFLIHKFLLAFPWARELPLLRQSVAIFDHSIESGKNYPEHIQPFIKIIMGDKSGIFPRKELGPLIACAVATERETHSTLMQYYSDDKFAATVEAFNDERNRRQRQRAQGAPVAPDNAVGDEELDHHEETGDLTNVQQQGSQLAPQNRAQ